MTECLTIKPHFCWQVYLWDDLFRISFLSVWSTLFLAAGYSNANDIDWWPTPFLLFAMICVPAVFLAAWQFGVMTYQNIEYRITQDRIEIGSGLFARQTVTSYFSDLDHVLFKQNALQMKYGIGSLVLVSRMPVARLAWSQKILAWWFVLASPRLLDVQEPNKILALLNERRDRALQS